MFDAYTLRKALPRLAVAVVAIQFSWSFCDWLITLANDAGNGIADILYAVFNNGNPITLTSLTGSGVNNGLFSVVALGVIGAGIVAGVMIFASLALAIPVIIGIMVAICVLVLRQVVILFCVILVPLAIVAWILPNTEKYWKLWWSTFSKMLMMFPLIIGMIVTGRIFAQLSAGGAGASPVAGGIAVFILVLLGYFGPYFFLPQTFKWGGQLMGAAGAAGTKFGKQAGERPAKFFRDRQADLSGERRRKSAERVMQNPEGFKGFNPRRPWRLPIDRVRSGAWDPTRGLPGSQRRKRSVGKYAAEGLGVEDEAIKAETAVVEGSIRGLARGDAIDHLKGQFNGANESKQQAILAKLGQLQAGDALTELRDNLLTNGNGEIWNRAVQRNYDSFKVTSPHLAAGASQTMMDANNGQGDTFTPQEDARAYANQSDQFISTMSGDGWHHFFNVAAGEAELRRNTIANSGQPYAANLSPESLKRLDRYRQISQPIVNQNIEYTAPGAAQSTHGNFVQMVQAMGGINAVNANNEHLISHRDLLDLFHGYANVAPGTPEHQLRQQVDAELTARGIQH